MTLIGENYFRYVPVRESGPDWGLTVTGAGVSVVPAGYDTYPVTPHPSTYDFTWQQGRKLPEYTMLYLTSGGGEFESTPTGRLSISEGNLVVLFPDVWHRYRPSTETGWCEKWVSFHGESVDRLVKQGFLSPERPVLAPSAQRTLSTAFDSLLHRLKTETLGFSDLISVNTLEILASVVAEVQPQSDELRGKQGKDRTRVDDRLVADALRLIWDESRCDMTVSDLEKQLPVTRRHLERRFRSVLGHTIYDEILNCRMERARKLLINTDLLLKEIAVSAGFPNADNMGRTFRRVEGVSPKLFRQQSRAAQ